MEISKGKETNPPVTPETPPDSKGAQGKASDGDPEPKKRGRPKGSRNAPTTAGPIEPKVRKTRKKPTEIKDTGAALKSTAADYNTLARRHMKTYPGSQVTVLPDNIFAGQLEKQQIPASVFRPVLEESVGLLAASLDVTHAVAPPEKFQRAAESWSELSRYVDIFNPAIVAGVSAGVATVGLIGVPVVAAVKGDTDTKRKAKETATETVRSTDPRAMAAAVERHGGKDPSDDGVTTPPVPVPKSQSEASPPEAPPQVASVDPASHEPFRMPGVKPSPKPSKKAPPKSGSKKK